MLPTGREGALFEWTVAPTTAERLAGDAGIIRPVFAPGDLLSDIHASSEYRAHLVNVMARRAVKSLGG